MKIWPDDVNERRSKIKEKGRVREEGADWEFGTCSAAAYCLPFFIQDFFLFTSRKSDSMEMQVDQSACPAKDPNLLIDASNRKSHTYDLQII